ncbi:MAG: hypothetical protein ACREDL_24145, partial [Bradyrhizobium sp.]
RSPRVDRCRLSGFATCRHGRPTFSSKQLVIFLMGAPSVKRLFICRSRALTAEDEIALPSVPCGDSTGIEFVTRLKRAGVQTWLETLVGASTKWLDTY